MTEQEYNALYYQLNKDKIRAYREKNKQRILDYNREYYQKNKEKINEQKRLHRLNKRLQDDD
jgi:hypothetical protein